MNKASEFEARLESLRRTGWQQGGEAAAEALRTWPAAKLKRAMRPHWKEAIDDAAELTLRESLDDGLDYLQLMEVVVQTGYLPLEAVEAEARAQCEALLGRAETHVYLLHYDYLLTRYLAARIGFPLTLPVVEPPPVEPQGALRCARLIATSAEWKADENIELFTQLLDDYWQYGIGAEQFRAYCKGDYQPQTAAQKERIARLEAGCSRMVHLLAALFEAVDEPGARRHLGAFFLYWIARFFGYRGGEKWGKSWAKTARRLAPEAEVALVEEAWAALEQA